MKHPILYVLLLSALLAACGKEIVGDSQKTEEEGKASQQTIEPSAKSYALSVTEAIEAEEGSYICVKAYIVGATTRSMKNLELQAPFTASAAIVLADKPTENETFTPDEELLLPVCLTDRKAAREALNLVDNPENHNRIVYLYGTRERYMSRAGLKKVEQFELAP